MTPNRQRFKQFLKNYATGVYMAPWTLQDLLHVKQHMYSHLHDSTVKKLYNKWGGSPRYVLQYAHDEFHQHRLNKILRASCILPYHSESERASDDQILHITPTSYATCQLRPTSRYAEELLEYYHDTMPAAVTELKRLCN
jgi:hypothetical protein